MRPLTPSTPALLAPLFDNTPASRCCWFGRLLIPMLLVRQVARPDGVGSQDARRDGALLCAVELLPDGAVHCAVGLLPDGALRLPWRQLLPDDAGAASAERQPLPHRLPLRSIPPAALRLRAPPIHEGHGRQRSVRKSSRLRWKHHLPSCSCSPGQATASSGPGAPDC